MSKTGAVTSKGKKVAVFPSDDVCVVFSNVTRTGLTSVAKPRKGPKAPPRLKIKQCYRIETTAEHSPPVEIRIVLPVMRGRLRLWRWYPLTKKWKDITQSYSRKYHLIVGKTSDRLESMFGVT